ncbi:Integrin alpha-3 CD49 antigen-like family member C Galactoprotein B3 [Larimichthys crocea]|uniref:Integrin alpha-3 CD49 antigen-like family member C Galactoprotein B3 n=1 Tax=Larimichthys crocea TaxID=215358 RepID=A0A6G0HZ76_LARCR|nr:Integrin alpha-3 CD49 antigen-like family member C Galactoprotein B3 [Larimichthys crocea]
MKSPNMSPRLLLCAVLAVYHGTQTCSGFNIDERFPVIKEGQTKGSFFGFSVALHEQTLGSKKYLLLAGAPKEKPISLRNVNETGAVYSCPITTHTSDCSRMDLVSTTSPSEMVEGMWLGVTVASQREQPAGRVLACGHRYVKITSAGTNEEQRRMIGKCFVRSNDLTFDPNDEWQIFSYEACNPNYDYELEGMCNMGISGGMTDTDVYIGASGSFMWQGNVHVTWRDPDPANAWDSVGKDFGQLKRRYSYMGYSVLESKNLLSRDDYTVVTGSPRDEAKGSVMIATQADKNLKPALIIPGEQVGSYFGNSLAVTDLNNDGWNDLIVGAPFYFDRMKDKGGAVYIFMNENGSFRKDATKMLDGPSTSGFGFAVAAIGDVNLDGFQDFAVGAPFHDSGKVYIWMGNQNKISTQPSQVIEGKSVGNGGFHTFGYSINGGMDMDDNSYPDILVGSLDDRIALLRARPVIQLTNTFEVEPRIVDPNTCPGDTPCITATVCMTFTLSNGNKDFKKNITVNFTVEADMDRRRSPRVLFQDKSDTYTNLLSLPSSKRTCHEMKLIVVESVRDKLEPVVFSLNMSLHEQKPKSRRSLQNLDSFPILSQGRKLSKRREIHFQKECGDDNKCSSNLKVTAQFVDNEEKPYPRMDKLQVLQFNSNIKRLSLMVEVTNFPGQGKLAEDAHEATLNVTIPDALRYSSVRPVGACTFDGTVICDLGNPLKGNEKVSLIIKFETSGIDLYTQEIESQLLLSTLSEQDDLKPFPVALLIENTILPSFSLAKPVVRTQFGGEVMGESAMVNTSDVGSLVEFTFNVNINGQPLGDMGTLAVEFEWPFEVANGKWLLYLTRIVVKGESEMECNPPGEVVNLLNLSLSESGRKRTKRQIVVDDADDTTKPHIIEPQAAITLLSHRKESYLLECSKGTARCVTFTCPLLNMTNSAKIYVRSRLWNSTMLEDYLNALIVQVKGQATLKLITDKPTIKMENQITTFAVEIEPVETLEAPYELQLWIIISAAVAGIVLLGIIILILWKCGFFQRASTREMYEAKAQKAEMKIQPSETERLTEDY